MKALERIGKTYGRLTVLGVGSMRTKTGRKLITLHCQCECGAIVDPVVGNVAMGFTTSCGCGAEARRTAEIAALVGQHFGKLQVMVLGEAGSAVCLCACGRSCTRWIHTLRQAKAKGNTSSCGCDLVASIVARNRARAKRYEYDGRLLTIPEWAEHFGVSRQAVHQRVQRRGSVGPRRPWVEKTARPCPICGEPFEGTVALDHAPFTCEKIACFIEHQQRAMAFMGKTDHSAAQVAEAERRARTRLAEERPEPGFDWSVAYLEDLQRFGFVNRPQLSSDGREAWPEGHFVRRRGSWYDLATSRRYTREPKYPPARLLALRRRFYMRGGRLGHLVEVPTPECYQFTPKEKP